MPSRDPEKLHPVVRRKFNAFIEAARVQGIPFILTQTDRLQKEQDAFWAQGREPLPVVNAFRDIAGLPHIGPMQNMKTITDVRVSTHQFGLAFDVALKGQKGGVHWDVKADINAKGGTDYDELGKLGESLGLIWGGRFRRRDLVHFEWTGGLTLNELKAGKRPPDAIDETEKKRPSVLTQAFDDEYPPEKQEAKMNPAILAYVPMILKTLIGKDVTEDAKAQGMDGKPFWLSRRFFHTGLTTVIGLAAMLGITIPADQAAILVDSAFQIVDVFKENAGLWAAIVSSAGAIWGTIRAGKTAKKKDKK